ncbi:MAG: hypothetical protein ABSG11_24025 [Candidatus Korobacteraceae bacterium]|jgi:hypothetical protein
MRFRKESRRIGVWLGAVTVIVLGFKVKPTVVQAGLGSVPGPKQAFVAEPAAPQLADSLAATAIPGIEVQADSVTVQPNLAKAGASVDLPPVEEFILTPPNPGHKTKLAVRFAPTSAGRLASSVRAILGDQSVVWQRSSDDPAIYSTFVDFDWSAFAREQARRQVQAEEGKLIPVFEGHRLQRVERMQFVDPEEIRQALQSHQPIRFTPLVLQGDPLNIVPDHELLINSIGVVEDPARTWDPCARTGTQMGEWTFGALMTAIANDNPSTHLIADAMVQSWLAEWSLQQNVNDFPVSARLGMVGVLRGWRLFASDRKGNIDISQAPFQLNAIVNRIDATSPANPSGELRFVFGYAPCHGGEGQPATFNVIVEYHVPVAQCSWATQWHSLDLAIGGPAFSRALEQITDQVTPTGSVNLANVRTNESFTSNFGIWEQRQFALSSGALVEVPIDQTPNGDPAAGRTDFNQETCVPGTNCQAAILTSYINTFQQDILNNNYQVPTTFPNPSDPFLGGSAFNGASVSQLVFWQGNPPPNSNQARSIFSGNTCNGCHGRETFVKFQQTENRQPGPPSTAVPSVLSAFLVGCSTSSQDNPLTDQTGPCPEPPTNACNLQNTLTRSPACISWVQDPGDPSGNTINRFAELSRRAQNLSTILRGCTSDGLLQSLAVHRLSSPH